MADQVNVRSHGKGGAQDTGNPVLDSLANILANTHLQWSVDDITSVHEQLLACAAKEPGGLKRRSTNGILQDAD